MNQEIKKLWVDALLSGNYNQGSSYLYNIGKDNVKRHCVLGVLCDLAYKQGIVKRTENEIPGIKYYDDKWSAYPPDAVIGWSEIDLSLLIQVRTLNDMNVPFLDLVKTIKNYK